MRKSLCDNTSWHARQDTRAFILPGKIVGTQEHFLLPQPMVIKKEVEVTDHCVGSLPTITCLVTKEVDLSWDGLTVDAKDCALSRGQEIDRLRI